MLFEPRTSDTLECQNTKQTDSNSSLDLNFLYNSNDSLIILSQMMSNLSFEKPLAVCQLVERLNNFNQIIYSSQQQSKSDKISHFSQQSQQKNQQTIDFKGKAIIQGLNVIGNQNQNIYSQYQYEQVLLPQLFEVFQNDSEKEAQKEQIAYQKVFTYQICIVNSSIRLIESLLTKISLYKLHSKKLNEKLKIKFVRIDTLRLKKQNLKNYTQQLFNLKRLIAQKLNFNIDCGEQIPNRSNVKDQNYREIQLLEFRSLESLIMKYQYVPYRMVVDMLERKLFSILQERIDNKVETRFMNLGMQKMVETWKKFISAYLIKSHATSMDLTLSTLSNNLLGLILYVKPDSRQFIEEQQSKDFKCKTNDILTLKFIQFSLTKLTSNFNHQEFVKISSILQFSEQTRRIHQLFKHIWFTIFHSGICRILSLSQALGLTENQLSFQGSESTRQYQQRQDKIDEDKSYGKVGEIMSTIKQLKTTFEPKYLWVWQGFISRLGNFSIQQQFQETPLSLMIKKLFNDSVRSKKQFMDQIKHQIVCGFVFNEVKDVKMLSKCANNSERIPENNQQQGILRELIKSIIKKDEGGKSLGTKKEEKKKEKKQKKSLGIDKEIKLVEYDRVDSLKCILSQRYVGFGVVQKIMMTNWLDQINGTSMNQQQMHTNMWLEKETLEVVKQMIGLLGQKQSAKKSNPNCNQLDSPLQGLVGKDKIQHETKEQNQLQGTVAKLLIEQIIHQWASDPNLTLDYQQCHLKLISIAIHTKRKLQYLSLSSHFINSPPSNCSSPNFQLHKTSPLSQIQTSPLSQIQKDIQIYSLRLQQLILSLQNHLIQSQKQKSKNKSFIFAITNNRFSTTPQIKSNQKQINQKLQDSYYEPNDERHCAIQISMLTGKIVHLLSLFSKQFLTFSHQIQALRTNFLQFQSHQSDYQEFWKAKTYAMAAVYKFMVLIQILEKKIIPSFVDQTSKNSNIKHFTISFNFIQSSLFEKSPSHHHPFSTCMQIPSSLQTYTLIEFLYFYHRSLHENFDPQFTIEQQSCLVKSPRSQLLLNRQKSSKANLLNNKIISEANKNEIEKNKKKQSKISSFVGSLFGNKKKQELKNKNSLNQLIKGRQNHSGIDLNQRSWFNQHKIDKKRHNCNQSSSILKEYEQIEQMQVEKFILLLLEIIQSSYDPAL